MTDTVTTPDGRAGLRLGRWQDVLADVTTCDAVITDPPYGARTHEGHYAGALGSDCRTGMSAKTGGTPVTRRALSYEAWTTEQRLEFVRHWGPLARGWICICTSHEIFDDYSQPLRGMGRYVFHPIPLVINAMTVRLAGDGPASWCIWLNVSRPSALSRWGALRGAYVGNPEARGTGHIGGKPLWLMRAIIRDYTKPDDLIVDPCAGGATTLLAAAIEGRYAIGAECDPETFEKTAARMRAGFTPDLFGGAA